MIIDVIKPMRDHVERILRFRVRLSRGAMETFA